MIDDLEPERCPASLDPSFSTLWGRAGGDATTLDRIVRRWRSQGR
jgi:hypothetical protein